MGITSIFYTEECYVCRATTSLPDKRGYVKTTHELISPNTIICSVTPISTTKSREKWGIHSTATCEISFDLDGSINPKDISAIIFNDDMYIVENYEIYPKFMILDESVTFACRRDSNG